MAETTKTRFGRVGGLQTNKRMDNAENVYPPIGVEILNNKEMVTRNVDIPNKTTGNQEKSQPTQQRRAFGPVTLQDQQQQGNVPLKKGWNFQEVEAPKKTEKGDFEKVFQQVRGEAPGGDSRCASSGPSVTSIHGGATAGSLNISLGQAAPLSSSPNKTQENLKTTQYFPTSSNFSIFCDESFEEELAQDDEEENKDGRNSCRSRTLSPASDDDEMFQEAKENLSADDIHNTTADLNNMVNGSSTGRPALRELSLDTSLCSNASMLTVIGSQESHLFTSTERSRANSLMDSEDCCDTSNKEQHDEDSLFNCMEYQEEILEYLLRRERKMMPDPDYMSKQQDINSKMRSILVDWMVEVTDEYKLADETLFLAVNFIDRFLSLMSIGRQSFQLLGSASLFISAKYEEIYPPDVNEFVYITDDSYSKTQVLQMETLILKTLKMNVSPPTSHYFMRNFLSILPVSSQVGAMSEFLVYLTLLDEVTFLAFTSSEIALSAVILATYSFGEEDVFQGLEGGSFLDSILSCMTRVTPGSNVKDRLSSCMQKLLTSQAAASSYPQEAIYTKYSQKKYFSVARDARILPQVPRL